MASSHDIIILLIVLLIVYFCLLQISSNRDLLQLLRVRKQGGSAKDKADIRNARQYRAVQETTAGEIAGELCFAGKIFIIIEIQPTTFVMCFY